MRLFGRFPLASVDGPFRDVLREWDSGQQSVRHKILETFVQKHKGSTAPELEAALGNAASLFLARLVSTLGITVPVGIPSATHLRAIGIFLAAASGHRFVLEFLEDGGIPIVMSVLQREAASAADKTEALSVLRLVASLGTKYKGLVCENDGIRTLVHCFAHPDDEVRDGARALLQMLALGNAEHGATVQRQVLACLSSQLPHVQRTAAMLLRSLESELPPTAEYIPLARLLLRSYDVQVQYEGRMLLRMLTERADLQQPTFKAIVELLTPSVNVIAEITRSDVDELQQGGGGGGRHTSRATLRAAPPAFVQQASAARLISEIASSSHSRAVQFLELGALKGLLLAATNLDYPDSQVASCLALRVLSKLVTEVEEALIKYLGQPLFYRLMGDPEGLARSMTSDIVTVFRQGVNRTSLFGPSLTFATQQVSSSEADGEHAAASAPATSAGRAQPQPQPQPQPSDAPLAQEARLSAKTSRTESAPPPRNENATAEARPTEASAPSSPTPTASVSSASGRSTPDRSLDMQFTSALSPVDGAGPAFALGAGRGFGSFAGRSSQRTGGSASGSGFAVAAAAVAAGTGTAASAGESSARAAGPTSALARVQADEQARFSDLLQDVVTDQLVHGRDETRTVQKSVKFADDAEPVRTQALRRRGTGPIPFAPVPLSAQKSTGSVGPVSDGPNTASELPRPSAKPAARPAQVPPAALVKSALLAGLPAATDSVARRIAKWDIHSRFDD